MYKLLIAISLALGCLVTQPYANVGTQAQNPEDYSIGFSSSIDTGGGLQEAVSEADIVLQAKAQTSSMRYGAPINAEAFPNRRFILRDYLFDVIRVFKGTVHEATRITVSVIGGSSVNGVPQPAGPPAFVEGREYILLLCGTKDEPVFWLTRGLSSAFDIGDSRVTPLSNSVSARGQRNVTRDRLVRSVTAYSKRNSTPKEIGYACGQN